jgi:hypothetical protein
MLAEIYMLQLEATAQAAKDADTVTRSTSQFVPIPSPPVKQNRPRAQSMRGDRTVAAS